MSEWSDEHETCVYSEERTAAKCGILNWRRTRWCKLIDEKGQCYMRSCSADSPAIEFFSNDKTLDKMSEKCTQPLQGMRQIDLREKRVFNPKTPNSYSDKASIEACSWEDWEPGRIELVLASNYSSEDRNHLNSHLGYQRKDMWRITYVLGAIVEDWLMLRC